MAEDQVLDLSGPPKRPTVKLPDGDFEMLMPEELTFDQFAAQVTLGKRILEKAEGATNPETLLELQDLVVEGSMQMLVDLPEETARTITPGMYLKISVFFKQLGDEIGSASSATGTNSADGSTDSSKEDQAAA